MNKNESFTSFYKGMTPKLISFPIINAIIFSSYEGTRRLINKDVWWEYMIAGAFAGSINCVVIGPIDLIKI